MNRPIVFFWDNLGPLHADRIGAVASAFGPERRVIGIALRDRSDTYDWDPVTPRFEQQTLFTGGAKPGLLARLGAMLNAFRRIGRATYFLCHGDWREVFLSASVLRLTGSTVIAMGCTKIDDRPRHAWREALKRVFFWPYAGAIGSGTRSRAYFHHLGIAKEAISGGYNTLSIARFRANAGRTSPPREADHARRPFVSVARLVEDKNLFGLLAAYRLYREGVQVPRRLDIYGSGPLEPLLRAEIAAHGLEHCVTLHGFVQTEALARQLDGGLALLLPSRVEAFGNAVIEAMALGLPVILSSACGASDELVRDGIEGYVVAHDDIEGLARHMRALDKDPVLWAQMAKAAWVGADRGDVANFVVAVREHLPR